jgi:monoterpene epsilon-lactone hydrolase
LSDAVLKRVFRVFLRLFYKPFLGPPFPVRFQRPFMELMTRILVPPKEVDREPFAGAEVPIARFGIGSGEAALRPAVLWVHGGGFLVGSASTHAGFAGYLAQAAGADVYLPDYRLAPEHPWPAATDDVFSAYRAILARGHDPARIAIGGDSAGGAIAILAALQLSEMDVPAPAAMVLISPVTDLSLSGASIVSRRRADPLLRREWLAEGYRAWAGPLALTDGRVSPLYADLEGLPPTLIQVGEDEILLDDSVRFADRAWAKGVEVELQRFPHLWHDFQLQAGLIGDSRAAVGDIGASLRSGWGI